MSRFTKRICQFCLIAASIFAFNSATTAEAGGYRQTYSSWNYHPTRTYYYTTYRYQPVVTVPTYHHHYCIHYPSRPRYVYYYNPVRRVYWGRYDLQESGYSMLKPEDQKGDLEAIPEAAFPKPSAMPPIPESTDGVAMAKPELKDLPSIKADVDTP